MRLITHNMLKSNIKGVEKGFPLGIEVVKTEDQELEFNPGTDKEYYTRKIFGGGVQKQTHVLDVSNVAAFRDGGYGMRALIAA